MRVSVVIPTFNRRAALGRALDSVCTQRYLPHEVIVVDDGSTDGTASFVRANYPNVALIEQENRGVSAARNAAITISSGDWIAFLDSDDRWHADKLEAQVRAVHNDPHAVLVHCNEIWIRDGHRVNEMNKHAKAGGWIFERCLPLCAISPSAAMVRRDVFHEIGTFDESLPACEDYDLWLRVCARYPVVFLPERLVTKYGGHPDQLSKKHWGMDRFRIQALERLLSDPDLPPAYKSAASSVLRSKIEVYLGGARKRRKMDEIALYESKLQRWSRERTDCGMC